MSSQPPIASRPLVGAPLTVVRPVRAGHRSVMALREGAAGGSCEGLNSPRWTVPTDPRFRYRRLPVRAELPRCLPIREHSFGRPARLQQPEDQSGKVRIRTGPNVAMPTTSRQSAEQLCSTCAGGNEPPSILARIQLHPWLIPSRPSREARAGRINLAACLDGSARATRRGRSGLRW